MSSSRSHAFLVGISALAVGLITGCTSTTPGQAETSSPSTSTAVVTFSNSAPSSTLHRPKDIDVRYTEPCKLLTTDQQIDLGTSSVNQSAPKTSKTGGKGCDYGHVAAQGSYHILIVTEPGEPVEKWLTSNNPTLNVQQVDIGGYPTAQYQEKQNPHRCVMAISTSDGQNLSVDFGGDPGAGWSPEQWCAKARQAATSAMETLKAKG